MFEDKMTRTKFLLFITLYFLIGFYCGAVYGQTNGVNIAIPQGNNSFQSDRVRAGDVECQAAIGSSTNVEFGVAGIINQNDPFYYDQYGPPMTNDEFVRDIAVYGRITIPIGAPKQRLNCNALYKLELEKKRLELIKLKQEIVNLQNLKFEQSQEK